MRAPTLTTLSLLALTAACDSAPSGPIVCTDDLRAGITVEVVDGSTGLAAATGAVLTLQDGEYSETWSESFDSSTLAGAWERAGTYDVAVAKGGHHTWIRSGVIVTADECHVHPVALRAELERLPVF